MKRRWVMLVGASLLVATGSAGFVFGGSEVLVSLAPTPLAANADLQDASGTARVRIDKGALTIDVDLGGAMLPPGSVLEGWVVDPGLDGGPGGPGLSSVSQLDEVYGTPFGDPNIDMLVDRAAYALSTGVLKRLGNGHYVGKFRIDNNLSPYNAVVITLESDANGLDDEGTDEYDPRPGTPVLAGPLP